MGLFGRIVVRVLPAMPRFIVGLVAKRYVAGEDLESAVTIMKNLGAKEGCSFTIDVLGEEISNMEEAKHFVNEYDRLIDAIVENDLEANLSVKPTAFGLLIYLLAEGTASDDPVFWRSASWGVLGDLAGLLVGGFSALGLFIMLVWLGEKNQPIPGPVEPLSEEERARVSEILEKHVPEEVSE